MNDIYSPPKADIHVEEAPPELTFLKSLGGFILSFVVVSLIVAAAGLMHRLVVARIVPVSPLLAFGFVRLLIYLVWIIAWPAYCRKQNWPNLYRGARWHRLFIVAVFVLGVLAIVVLALTR